MQRAASRTPLALPFGVEVRVPFERILSDDVKTRPLDEEKVQDLMVSFLSKGQQQSVKLRPEGEYYYRVTFGEHRTEAGRRLAEGLAPERIMRALTPGELAERRVRQPAPGATA